MSRNRLHERNTNPRYGVAIPRRRIKQQLRAWVRSHSPRVDLSGITGNGWR